MFDLRIILAVIATLWALGVGMANGVLDLTGVSSFSVSDVATDLPFFKNDAVIPIEASLQSDKIPTFNKVFRKELPEVHFSYYSGSGSLFVQNSEIGSSLEIAEVDLLNYKGSVKFGEFFEIDGEAEEVRIGEVTLKDVSIRSGPLNTLSFQIFGAPPTNYEFEKVTGSFTSTETTISFENKPISLKSFEGDAEFFFEENNYVFTGRVSRLYSPGNPILSLDN